MQNRMFIYLGANFFLVVALCPVSTLAAEAHCDPVLAVLASAEGLVEMGAKDNDTWRPVHTAESFCPGDRIRVGANSRAALVLSNHTVMRLDALSTLNFTDSPDKDSLWVQLRHGISHFISRVPRRLTVSTPYMNAGVEGTEFLVTADERQSTVTVFEGQVAAGNPYGEMRLVSGQSVTATAGTAPSLRLVIRPRDALQWALHYPSVTQFDAADFAGQTPLAESIAQFNKGDGTGALSTIENLGEGIADATFFNYRASLYLNVGRVETARVDIERALQLNALNSDALSLLSIIALIQSDKDRALELATQAVGVAPHAAGPRLALSYAWQARFDLQQARTEVQQATENAPQNALAWARLAELHLMFGDRGNALTAAQEAQHLNPYLARTHSVLGFAYLSDIELQAARTAFEQAAALDPSDPLPQLGLGLAAVREGELTRGRQHIELAASLDPDNALVRSYLGKAYYEERRDSRAASQFDIAKTLDPNDPTPWFYDAILKQSTNRPVEALQDLQSSIALNDNRAVYRSRLLLDNDAAARSASLARIYGDLGYQQLALMEGWKSLHTDPANHSAHRLLADTYSALPRHENARVSELLQAQLMQPYNLTPLHARLSQTDLAILKNAGPETPAYSEYNSLFLRDQTALQVSALAGAQQTLGDEITLYGIQGEQSYSLSQFHWESDGFRVNNDSTTDLFNAFFQTRLSPKSNLQVEYRNEDVEQGQLDLLFGAQPFPAFRRQQDANTYRLGFHQTLNPDSDFLVSLMYQSIDFQQQQIDASNRSTDVDIARHGPTLELQHLLQYRTLKLVTGLSWTKQRLDENNTIVDPLFPFFPFVSKQSTDQQMQKAYGYSYFHFNKDFILTAGAGLETFEKGVHEEIQLNPKLGLSWMPNPTTTVRAAAFRTLKGTRQHTQTIEPTHVAGFNQFYDNAAGSKARRYGIGIDKTFSPSLFGGMEVSAHELKVPLFGFSSENTSYYDWYEQTDRLYLYWSPLARWVVSLDYLFENFDIDRRVNEGVINASTHRVPLSLRYAHPGGFTPRLTITYFDQSGDFDTENAAATTVSGSDSFWILDIAIDYRLPRRSGMITMGTNNLFDEEFQFQDTDPGNPRIRPDQFWFARVTFSFNN